MKGPFGIAVHQIEFIGPIRSHRPLYRRCHHKLWSCRLRTQRGLKLCLQRMGCTSRLRRVLCQHDAQRLPAEVDARSRRHRRMQKGPLRAGQVKKARQQLNRLRTKLRRNQPDKNTSPRSASAHLGPS